MISSKILIIDDDVRIINSLKLALKEYEISSFNDGQSALTYLSKPHEIDLIILDVCMKGLNGLEVLEQLKKHHKDIPVLMLTGQATQDIILESLRFHADEFIEKPYDINDLRDRIKKLLKNKEHFNVNAYDRSIHAERIRQYIDRNYANVTLEEVAGELCLSTKYVGQIFLGSNKEGFREYRLRVRMEEAQKMLAGSCMSVTQIAFKLGYENPESFMRAFKKYNKITPMQYRDQLKRSPKHVHGSKNSHR